QVPPKARLYRRAAAVPRKAHEPDARRANRVRQFDDGGILAHGLEAKMRALVTGGTSGIGKAIAMTFREDGIETAVVSRRVGFDLIDPEARKRAWEQFGPVDILVNNI